MGSRGLLVAGGLRVFNYIQARMSTADRKFFNTDQRTHLDSLLAAGDLWAASCYLARLDAPETQAEKDKKKLLANLPLLETIVRTHSTSDEHIVHIKRIIQEAEPESDNLWISIGTVGRMDDDFRILLRDSVTEFCEKLGVRFDWNYY